MKLDIDHEPGELAEKLPGLLARLAELAAADAEALEKGRRQVAREHAGPPEAAEAFRFDPTRAMFTHGMKIAEARRARMAARVAEVLGVA